MKASDVRCRRCDAMAHVCPGWLERVTPVGESNPEWECRTACSASSMDDESRLVGAIEHQELPND